MLRALGIYDKTDKWPLVVVVVVKAAATRIGEELKAAGEAAKEEAEDATENRTGSSKRKARKEKAQDAVHNAEAEGLHIWEVAKDALLRPGVAGGLIGVGTWHLSAVIIDCPPRRHRAPLAPPFMLVADTVPFTQST